MARFQGERRNTVVATLRNAMSANMAAAILRTQGVIAAVESAPAGTGPSLDDPPEGVNLTVAPEDEARAREILAQRGLIV
jgi:hypothetical protein